MKNLYKIAVALLRILSPSERRRFALLVGLAFIVALFEMAQLGLIFPIIGSVVNSDLITKNPILGGILQTFHVGSGKYQVLFFLSLMIVVAVFKAAFGLIFVRVQSHMLTRGAARLIGELCQAYLYAPIPFHLERNSGELLRNIRALGQNIYAQGILGLLSVIQASLNFMMISVLVLALNPVLVLFAVVLIGSMVALQQLITGRIHRRLSEERLDLTRRANIAIITALDAIKEMQLLHAQDHFLKRVGKVVTAEQRNAQKNQFYLQMPGIVNEAILAIGIAIVFGAGVLLMNSASVLPWLAVMAGVAYRYLPSAARISAGLNQLRTSEPSIEKYQEELAILAPLLRNDGTAAIEPRPFDREIRFENVSFTHNSAATPSVDGLTLTIRKGEMIGVVGGSGSGKTTLAYLLLGLYRPQSGRIMVDGEDIRKNLAGWQANLGFVPQQVVVVDDTIRRNVAFGVDDEMIDDARVRAVLADARLLDRVNSEPQGLDAVVGERGVKLSGGEIQRLGIARALFHGARVLILDEATSALDSSTEVAITNLIKTLSANITVFIIAHRLSTLRHVDRLIYMREGRRVSEGSFEEIAASDSAFRELLRNAEFVASPQPS